MGKMRKSRVLIGLLVAVIFALAGCGNRSREKIVYMTYDDRAVFGSLIRREFTDIARKNGQPVEFLDAKGDAELQIEQFRQAAEAGARAFILLAVDETRIVPEVEKAIDEGIIVVAVNRHLRSDKVCGVYSDEYGAGRLQAEYMERNLPAGAGVFYLKGPGAQLSSELRWEGFRDRCLEKRPDIQLFDIREGKYLREEARRITEGWIRDNAQIDAIVCANDEMALGALHALKEANRSRSCMIAGVDALPEALDAIAAGGMRMTVKQDAQRQAQGAYQLITALLAGEKKQGDIKVPFMVVTKDNLAQFRK